MIEAVREAVAIGIFAVRLGFNARSKVSIGLMNDGLAVFLLAENGEIVSLRIRGGHEGHSTDEIIAKWKEAMRAVIEKEMPESRVQEIWEASNFSKSGTLDRVIAYMHQNNLLIPRAFKLPGDREFRCAICGERPVAGGVENETCEVCIKASIEGE